MSSYVKFGLGALVLVGTVAWLARAGYQEGMSYYWTVNEVTAMGAEAHGKRIMLMGYLVEGSVRHADGHLNFTLENEGSSLPVVYTGTAPVPDTFREGQQIQALVEGRLDAAGHFDGKKIQAKCASKYDSDPSSLYTGGQDVTQLN